MMNLAAFISVFLLSWLGVGAFRKWSETRSMLDVPNERSSHNDPTPVGGGLVIVFFTITSMFVYEIFAGYGIRMWGFYAGGLAIAAISWFDDIKPVPVVLRFAVHIFGAVAAVAQIGYINELTFWPGSQLILGGAGSILSVLWIVWMTNAYNFMDGIDGLAGTQAAVAAAGWSIYSAYAGNEFLLFGSIALLASSMGFLVHNWPPAKVFMGDVGSAFLGYSFAVFPLIALNSNSNVIPVGAIPLMAAGFVWLFLSDSVVTLLRRTISGEKLWKPHRKHMYQELVKAEISHLRVTLFYGALMIIAAAAVLTEVFSGLSGLAAAACISVLVLVAAAVTVCSRETN